MRISTLVLGPLKKTKIYGQKNCSKNTEKQKHYKIRAAVNHVEVTQRIKNMPLIST